jgi:hypothetical protein
MSRFIAALLMVIAALAPSVAPADPPKLSRLVPVAAAPGQTVEITLLGSNLAEPTGLWTNLPAVVEMAGGGPKNGKEPSTVTYRFKLPAQVPLGVYGVRLANGKGISNLRLLAVDDLPTVREADGNSTAKKAQEVQLPCGIEGRVEAESYDYYKFHADAGQRLSFEVLARRLGSSLDPVLRLLDSQGRELAYSDDDEALGADGRFVYRFSRAGDYLLELRDIRYQGGNDYFYRLRVGDFPLVTAAYPLGVQKGSRTPVEATGPASGEVVRVEANAPADLAASRLNLKVQTPGGHGSAPLSVLVTNDIEQVEFEPNDTREQATVIEARGAINARFGLPHDRDHFRFAAKKGQQLMLVGRTRSLGSPSDLFMRLFDAKGTQLAEVEDTGAEEGAINYTFPADGDYTLAVEDLLHHGGPDHVYRVEFRPNRADFTLTADADKFDVPQGGIFTTKITAVRRGYKGPIELALKGLDEKCELTGATIPDGKVVTTLTVSMPSSLTAGAWRVLQIVGRATIEKEPFETAVETLPALRIALNGAPNPPAALDGQFAVGIGPVFPAFFKLDAGSKPIELVQLLGKTSFTVKATRLEKFADAITLAAEGLPSGFDLKVAPLAKGKTEATLELTGPRTVAEGDYPFRLVGTGTYLNQPGRVALDLILHVARPLAVKVTPLGQFPIGGKQKLKVQLTRGTAAVGPVRVVCQSLPAKLKAAEATIAAGQNEAEIELNVEAGARPASVPLVLAATTKIGEQEINVASEPVMLEIVRP